MVAIRPRLLVVDDEPLARTRLLRLCQRLDMFEDIVLSAGGRAALQQVSNTKPHILLLDVDMPDLSGLKVAEFCEGLMQTPEIIFTTAHSKYAVDAFRLEATDYLLKPVKEALLREAIDRAVKNLNRSDGDTKMPESQRLWVQDGRGSVQLLVSNIERIEAERDYMRVHLEGRSYLLHQSMRVLEKKLPSSQFVRIHRSTIVRRDFIEEIRRAGRRRYLVLKDGTQLTIGASFADRLDTFNQVGGTGVSDMVSE